MKKLLSLILVLTLLVSTFSGVTVSASEPQDDAITKEMVKNLMNSLFSESRYVGVFTLDDGSKYEAYVTSGTISSDAGDVSYNDYPSYYFFEKESGRLVTEIDLITALCSIAFMDEGRNLGSMREARGDLSQFLDIRDLLEAKKITDQINSFLMEIAGSLSGQLMAGGITSASTAKEIIEFTEKQLLDDLLTDYADFILKQIANYEVHEYLCAIDYLEELDGQLETFENSHYEYTYANAKKYCAAAQRYYMSMFMVIAMTEHIIEDETDVWDALCDLFLDYLNGLTGSSLELVKNRANTEYLKKYFGSEKWVYAFRLLEYSSKTNGFVREAATLGAEAIPLFQGVSDVYDAAMDVMNNFEFTPFILFARVAYTLAETIVETVTEHTHEFTVRNWEEEHPHRIYMTCACGTDEVMWTDEYYYDGTTVFYEDEHPHEEYKWCFACCYKEYTGKNGYNNYCTDCNPSAGGSASTFTITYNANGGTGTIASQTSTNGAAIVVAAGTGLSKSGYTFGGWNTKADGSGTAYAAGATLTKTTTLYAQWLPSTPTQVPASNAGIKAVAGNNTFYFETLNTSVAVWAANFPGGATITLLKNHSLAAKVTFPVMTAANPVILDLNGYTLTNANASTGIVLNGNAVFTLKNGTFKQTGNANAIQVSETGAGNNDGNGNYYKATLTFDKVFVINTSTVDAAAVVESKYRDIDFNFTDSIIWAAHTNFRATFRLENHVWSTVVATNSIIGGGNADRVFSIAQMSGQTPYNLDITATDSVFANGDGSIGNGTRNKVNGFQWGAVDTHLIHLVQSCGATAVTNFSFTAPDGTVLTSPKAATFGTAPTSITLPAPGGSTSPTINIDVLAAGTCTVEDAKATWVIADTNQDSTGDALAVTVSQDAVETAQACLVIYDEAGRMLGIKIVELKKGENGTLKLDLPAGKMPANFKLILLGEGSAPITAAMGDTITTA